MKNLYINKQEKKLFLLIITVSLFLFSSVKGTAQIANIGKKISSDLFGLFIEDINYAADGGLYAELVQNRSFEYNPAERKEWNPFSYWEFISPGFSYGRVSVENSSPIHPNNPHYLVLDVEHVGHEAQYTGIAGVGIKNSGFDGIVVREGENYNLTLFARQLSDLPVKLSLSLQYSNGNILAENTVTVSSAAWQKYTVSFTSNANYDTAFLVILATTESKFAIDVVSLFPEKTFKNRPNGMRADLAQVLADMEPSFIRFPGGCLAHGDGLGNMYRWKNTIGPIEQRIEQRNIWGYNQTGGLGYFEYFQFCEDIGAKPLPVLPAAVSCQNSGGTWRIGGTGQQALPMDEMQNYVQEVLDLIEWANGPETSAWGAKRAAAGHPAPFNLEYIGIGNEDKITPEFEERFTMICNAIRAKYPEIFIVGTSGPFHSGEDFVKGWKLANELKIPIVDEHYYTSPEWLISNHYRYDNYPRNEGQVYLGEYATWGNKLRNAIAEAAYMTSLERNGDVVRMASYAPLFAKKNFTQWTTDLIFFDNVSVCLTPNYYVQKMFSANQGDYYFDNVVTRDMKDTTLAASCVQNSESGDIILKLVNAGSEAKTLKVDLGDFNKPASVATKTILTGIADAENTFDNPQNIFPVITTIKVGKSLEYIAPAMSLTVLRIKSKK
jgi:alpha-N-arabinofuranosidase